MNLQDNVSSTAMRCDYKMVDTDYFLPVLMNRYFLENSVGHSRFHAFLKYVPPECEACLTV